MLPFGSLTLFFSNSISTTDKPRSNDILLDPSRIFLAVCAVINGGMFFKGDNVCLHAKTYLFSIASTKD